MERRVRKITDNAYVVDEQVIPASKHWASGSYITWPNTYSTKERAEKAIRDN